MVQPQCQHSLLVLSLLTASARKLSLACTITPPTCTVDFRVFVALVGVSLDVRLYANDASCWHRVRLWTVLVHRDVGDAQVPQSSIIIAQSDVIVRLLHHHLHPCCGELLDRHVITALRLAPSVKVYGGILPILIKLERVLALKGQALSRTSHSGVLVSYAFHACVSASPFRACYCYSNPNL